MYSEHELLIEIVSAFSRAFVLAKKHDGFPAVNHDRKRCRDCVRSRRSKVRLKIKARSRQWQVFQYPSAVGTITASGACTPPKSADVRWWHLLAATRRAADYSSRCPFVHGRSSLFVRPSRSRADFSAYPRAVGANQFLAFFGVFTCSLRVGAPTAFARLSAVVAFCFFHAAPRYPRCVARRSGPSALLARRRRIHARVTR